MEKYQQTAIAPRLERHERTDVRKNIESYVINPTRELAAYGAVIGLGMALMLIGYTFVSRGYLGGTGLYLLALPALGYGVTGFVIGRTRLNSFEPEILVDEIEYQTPLPKPKPEARTVNKNGEQMTISRSSKTVALNGKAFVFDSKHLTNMEYLLEKQDRISRDAVGISGSVWGDVCSIMVGKGLWQKEEAHPHPKYFWTESGRDWLAKI